MTRIARRDILRWGLGGLASGSMLPGALQTMAQANALASAENLSQKLLMVFLRGGNDALTTLVPTSALDTGYGSLRNKPGTSAWVDPASALRLAGTNYVRLNPMMQPLAGVGSPDAAHHIAWLMQVGNPKGLRSHFTEMQILETATQAAESQLSKEGLVPRLIAKAPSLLISDIKGVSVSRLMQRWFQSTAEPLVHLRDVASFQAATLASGVAPHYSVAPPVGPQGYVHLVGSKLFKASAEIRSLANPIQHDAVRFPANAAEAAAVGLPQSPQGNSFMQALEGALYLLRQSNCSIAGVELEGFDTHGDQMAIQNVLLAHLAHGLRSVYDLTVGDTSVDFTTGVFSEFGRTIAVNGNDGTDHGIGGLAIVMGRKVVGGVYNATPSTWTSMASLAAMPVSDPLANALPARTHYALVYRELIEKLFQVASTDMNEVLPVLAGLGGSNLGFLV